MATVAVFQRVTRIAPFPADDLEKSRSFYLYVSEDGVDCPAVHERSMSTFETANPGYSCRGLILDNFQELLSKGVTQRGSQEK